jgi:hypothetical protein
MTIVSPPPSSRWYKKWLPRHPDSSPPSSSSLPSPGRTVTLLPSVKLFYFTPSTCSAWIFPLEHRTQDLLITAPLTFVTNQLGETDGRDPNMLSLPIFILIHLSLSSGTTPHHLMLQNQTPLTAWVVWDPHTGAFTWCFGALVQMDCILIGRMQHSLAELTSSCVCSKTQGSRPGFLVLPWGWTTLKASCPFPQPYLPS